MSHRIRYWITSLAIVVAAVLFVYAGSLLYQSGALESGNRYLTMTGIALGTFVSEDLSTITSGLLAASGSLSYLQAVGAAFAGIFIGDLIIFWMGYHFGRPFLRHRWSRFIVSERSVNRAQHHFHRNGAWLIILSRFLPGTRTATYFAAGALHAPFLRFVFAFALAAAVWTPLLVGLSYSIGRELLDIYDVYESLAIPALILIALILYLLFHYGLPLLTWKGRRRLRGKWIRATKWEFWPVWQVNWLVVLYVLWIGVFRYRKPTLFTAANPCMPDGGFLGESKGDILAGLAGAGECMPKWDRIDEPSSSGRITAFSKAMENLDLSYPVVLKPDEGQRGAGVKVVRDERQAMAWLKNTSGTAILQEFVSGNEYGVFYVRRPDEAVGTIPSITIKEQLLITGNGNDSIETLIHAHPRAIVMLGTFLDRFDERLEEVPAEGEVIQLGELGTHARGSLFLDGRHLLTPELASRIQSIADSYDGFYFGRFDIKAPSEESFRKGEGLRVIELNGVTSEETHIYDPKHGLLHAWGTLCRQWRTAFEIGKVNSRNGHSVTSMTGFLINLFHSRSRQGRNT
jgi:membrane protein DedA with SNARE-associated domain